MQAWTGFEPMGAVLYQLSYQANWELVTLWVRNLPIEGDNVLAQNPPSNAPDALV